VIYPGSEWSSDIGVEIYEVVEESSKNIEDRMETVIYTGKDLGV